MSLLAPQQLRTEELDQAVVEVFTLMLGLPCTPSGPCTSVRPCTPSADCVFASVAFTGCIRGTCVLGLGRRTASLLTDLLLGIEPQSLPDEEQHTLLADTVGELCNMIAGGWKSRLPQALASCTLAPPQPLTDRPPQAACIPSRLYRFYSLSNECIEVELTVDTANIA